MKTLFVKRLVSALALLALVGTSACTAATAAMSERDTELKPIARGTPALTLLWPINGSVLPNHGDMIVYVEVSNFKLVDKAGKPNIDGEGHILYFMDEEAPTDPGIFALAEDGSYASSFETSHTWYNIPCGPHTFSAQLGNNDNTPLSPPVVVKSAVALHAPD